MIEIWSIAIIVGLGGGGGGRVGNVGRQQRVVRGHVGGGAAACLSAVHNWFERIMDRGFKKLRLLGDEGWYFRARCC